MPTINERVSDLEMTLTRFIDQTNAMMAEIRSSNARTDRQLLEMQLQAEKDRNEFNERYENDRKEFNERYEKDRKEFNERHEKDRKDFNKRMAELSDSMGTLIEDM